MPAHRKTRTSFVFNDGAFVANSFPGNPVDVAPVVLERDDLEAVVELLEKNRWRFESTKGRIIEDARANGISSEVIEAFDKIPREKFVHPRLLEFAYFDCPLPIVGHEQPKLYEQRLSKPSYLLKVLNWLQLSSTDRVLQLYTGIGYTTALLSKISGEVVTIDPMEKFVKEAGRVLHELGITNVTLSRLKDRLGYPQKAPYDRILVTSTVPEVPNGLLSQLQDGGKMIIPVVDNLKTRLEEFAKEPLPQQSLYRLIKNRGSTTEYLGSCRFTPLKELW